MSPKFRIPHRSSSHPYNAAIYGWLVLVSRTHRDAIADLTEDEAVELGVLTRAVSIALHDITSCRKTYIAQFAEHPDHRHVHVHVVAVAHDQPPEWQGPGIFAALKGEAVPESDRNELALALRAHPAFEPWRPA